MITVFTPTYNRCYIIDSLYQSLLRQTNKDFEWIVVDDGSTDDTEAYFNTILKNDTPFKILYKKQKNGGKHRALNVGVTLATGDLFFIVDSDDYLTDDAIEKVYKWKLTLDNSHKWAGVSGARGFTIDKHIGGIYNKKGFVDCKNNQRSKFNLYGDKAEVYFTDVLRKYPFPEFEGENFITEEVVWNAIAIDGYYLRWYSDIIYICDYLEDGLTKNSTKNKKNPQGVLAWYKIQLKAFPHNIKKKASAVCAYYDAVCETKNIKSVATDLGVSVLYIKLALKVRDVFYSNTK